MHNFDQEGRYESSLYEKIAGAGPFEGEWKFCLFHHAGGCRAEFKSLQKHLKLQPFIV
jgi:hypothetical protein